MVRNTVGRLDAAKSEETRAGIVGESSAIRDLLSVVEKVAPLNVAVLITGETGTGKDLIARAIHEASGRRTFVTLNCSAVPESLIESELFGHVRGSFTGAVANRRGIIEEAVGGSLFLDEISTMPEPMQAKLLRVLEDRLVRPIGSNRATPVDFRLISATNEDLAKKVRQGEFREDLYYRLNVFPIRVPPLRERRDDIPLLAHHFRHRFAQLNGVVPPPFSDTMLSRLSEMDWPGNVRQLASFIDRVIALRIGASDLRCDDPCMCQPGKPVILSRAEFLGWDLATLEREYIDAVLRSTGGHKGRAAGILGIDRRTLYRKLSDSWTPTSPDTPIRVI